jgi:hypothetical protein
MKKHNLSAVFCSDSIIDDLVYLTAAAGITVVSLPTSFLFLHSFLLSFCNLLICLFFYLLTCLFTRLFISSLRDVNRPLPV